MAKRITAAVLRVLKTDVKTTHAYQRPVRHKGRRNPCNAIAQWALIRRRILERDSYQCRICGSEDTGAALNVHHIDYDRSHNQDVNLVTLCADCHRAVHREGYKPYLYVDWPVPWGKHPE